MKLKQLTRYSSAALAVLGISLSEPAAAEVSWIAGTDGAWEVAANWLEKDSDPALNRVPINGEWIRPRAAGVTITYSAASGTQALGGSTIWQDSSATSAFLFSGGDLEVNQIYLAKTKANDTIVNFKVTDGALFVNRNLNMTWSNSSSIDSTFQQTGGSTRFGDGTGDGIYMCIKSGSQVATYDLEGGDLEAANIIMTSGGSNQTATFNQGEGTNAVINFRLEMGKTAGTTGGAVYNLDGGTLTIEREVDPFVFHQPGAPVYFDFDGGTLNLKGTWDFASLTGIANSDFRVAGVAATAGDLVFTPVTIDTDGYTQITISTAMDPVITSITALGGGAWELTLKGEATTGYEFRSSPILKFSPGALVENLSAGGVPVGTIGGTNDSVLTTDGSGDGTARMALSGSPADFVLAQTAPPPPPVTLFSEKFDGTTPGSLPTDWASGKNPADNSSLTSWELGTPANVGPIPPGVPLPSGSNCVATNIMGNYDDPVSDLGVAHTDIWLRSPAIDLGTATAGMLTFQQWTEIEDVPGDLDYGSIRILDASDDSELAVMEDQTIDGSTSGWEEYSMALPAAAFTAAAGTIKVEFRFEGDDIDSFAGWYIDDVTVTVPGS